MYFLRLGTTKLLCQRLPCSLKPDVLELTWSLNRHSRHRVNRRAWLLPPLRRISHVCLILRLHNYTFRSFSRTTRFTMPAAS